MRRLTVDDRRRVILDRALRVGPAVWLGQPDGDESIPVRVVDFTSKEMARIRIDLPVHGQEGGREKLVCPSSLSLLGPGRDQKARGTP